MMKKIIRFFTVLVFFAAISLRSFSQSSDKGQSIGFQLNPYLDRQFFNGIFIKPVFALRYSKNITDNLSLGPEFSGHLLKPMNHENDLKASSINLGAFVRYTFLPDSRIRPFAEFSLYYTFNHTESSTIITPEGTGMDLRSEYLTGYIGPGITLVSKSERFSLDLFYKFSNKYFVSGNKSAFTYRLNINF